MARALGQLKKRSEFLRVAAGGRKWVTPGLILQAKPREGAQDSGEQGGEHESGASAIRYGLTASRKVGNAVERNRARRRLRAVAREILPREGRAGWDYVLIARKGTLTRPHSALGADLSSALERTGRDAPRRKKKEPQEA